MDDLTVFYKVLFLSLEICFKYWIKSWQLLIQFYLPDLLKKGFEFFWIELNSLNLS